MTNAAPRTLRMILNTFTSGPQAWFFLAAERGYLREEGIELEFTDGDTAANAVPRVASGEFDIGYGDMNALIELAAAGGEAQAVGVFATFNASPYTIAVPTASTIHAPEDLTGRSLGSHPNDAAMRLWPELAQKAGIDPASIKIDISSLPHPHMLRLMIDQSAWEGMFGFVNTLRAAAIEAGIDSEKALRFLEYRHHVPDLYGAALMVSRTLIDNTPDTIARYNRDGIRVFANQALANGIEGGLEAVLGKTPVEIPGGEQSQIYQAKLHEVLATGADTEFESVWLDKHGQEVCSHIRLTAEFDANGTVVTVLAVGRDITERNNFRQKIHQMAFYDDLTSLPNRALFNDRLHQVLHDAKWHDQLAGVMLLDLDRRDDFVEYLGLPLQHECFHQRILGEPWQWHC